MMSTRFPQRGEIYFAYLDPVIGSQQGGIRPVLIIQNDDGNEFSTIVIVATITSAPAKRVYPIDVSIYSEHSGLRSGSRVMLNQIRSIDKRRLDKYVGSLDQAEMDRVDIALKRSLNLK